ncbi:MAG: hypothetical protein A3A83_00150 [Candidatus Doudnabacteria bacterium RIFCSPLOWO2_01_FULL_48_57]|nr:MAG: hypothetical protein A3A83_00150 [Candidatus Doudnabacteria bacterium RIFCSPLOWO2_01_FULL_48_57]
MAGFYLRHRYSEDLDFFSESEFTPLEADVFLKQLKAVLSFEKLDYQQTFNRNLYFLHFPDEVLKVEFTYFPFPRIETSVTHEGLQLDSLRDIAVNKLFSIYQRSVARDYIDLYCIVRQTGYTIADLASQARIKFDFMIDPLQLGTQFLKAETAADLPRMIENIDDKLWREFFRREAEKLKPQILTD